MAIISVTERVIMKNWDILEITINSVNTIDIVCTNQAEIEVLCKHILEEGLKYFAYVNTAGKHKLEISKPRWTVTGHHASVFVSPSSSSESFRYDDNIFQKDLKYFVLNIISSNGWLPYPGNGDASRFIKYDV